MIQNEKKKKKEHKHIPAIVMNGIMLPLCGNMTSFQETSLSFFDITKIKYKKETDVCRVVLPTSTNTYEFNTTAQLKCVPKPQLIPSWSHAPSPSFFLFSIFPLYLLQFHALTHQDSTKYYSI